MPFRVSASACGVALWALILLMSACALTMLAAGLQATSLMPNHAGAAESALSTQRDYVLCLACFANELFELAASAVQAQHCL